MMNSESSILGEKQICEHTDNNGSNFKTAAFMTLGCKVNFYETEKMCEHFSKAGYQIVEFSEVAQVYIINTCTVTNIADRKSRKMIHRAKKINPRAVVAAVGCYAQAAKEVLEADQMIDLVVGNDGKENIVDIIEGYVFRNKKVNTLQVEDHKWEPTKTRVRAYIKIQEGCNQFCSYCIIPYVRGKLESKPENQILQEVEELVSRGCKEIVLTGIHLSSYGVDFTVRKSFIELEGDPLLSLIKKMSAIEELKRIRLGSLEPRIITEKFVREIAKQKKVCPHFHLSLQSGSNMTLKRMNRKYTPVEFENACVLIRNKYNEPAITTDIIVGFPGETDTEFEETKLFVERVAFSQMHVFKYSVRSGTKAEKMEEQVSEEVKNRRSKEMLLLDKRLRLEYLGSSLGNSEKMLIEEKQNLGNENYYVGHNERYMKLAVACTEFHENFKNPGNEIITVIPIKPMDSETLLCTLKK